MLRRLPALTARRGLLAAAAIPVAAVVFLGHPGQPDDAGGATQATGAPGAPRSPIAVPGDHSVTLRWKAPRSSGGSPITSYTITGARRDRALRPIVTGSKATRFQIDHLVNGAPYFFEIAATNANGTGSPSARSRVVTPLPPKTVSRPPRGISAEIGNASVTLTWKAPGFTGRTPILRYRVTPYAGDTAGHPVVAPAGATTLTIGGLPNGIGYRFGIEAVNAIGASEVAFSPTVGPAPPLRPTPLISRGVPAYGDGTVVYDPALGNDDRYDGGGGSYRCYPECSLILDLSRVAAERRQAVAVAWYNEDSVFDAAGIGAPAYNEPRDYTIEAHTAAGGTPPPADGWRVLVDVKGNVLNGRVHYVGLGGANWLRLHVTASNGTADNMDASFNLDVHDATLGNTDAWLFLGDSITMVDMGHYEPLNFMQQVAAAEAPRFPIQVNGGIGGWAATSPLQLNPQTGRPYIDDYLDTFPGRYVTLDYGTNDANNGRDSTRAFTGAMTALIRKVIAANKIPVLRRSIPWGCTPGIQTYGPQINAKLQELLKRFPEAVAGPDPWTTFKANPSLLNADCIHPNEQGAPVYRKLYADALLAAPFDRSPPSR